MQKNKAFVCFCVDGPSEIDALRIQFEDLFDQAFGDDINVDFRFAEFQKENHGDITSLSEVTPEKVEKLIYKYYFKQQDRSSDLGWDDVTHIIHIIDMDGAYVKDEDILEFNEEEAELAKKLSGKKAKTALYMDDHIAVTDTVTKYRTAVEMMRERNKRKRQIIEYLLSIEKMKVGRKEVAYELYYFSSNLDHYLYGEANLKGNEKTKKASDFTTFNGTGDLLRQFFAESEFSTKEDYDASWKSIRKKNASLTRGTNLNLLIDRIGNSSLEDWL